MDGLMTFFVQRISLLLLLLAASFAGLCQFTPSDIDGLEMWVKADSAVSLNAQGFVTQWNDLSGQNHHCTTPDALSRPLLVTDALENKSIIRFDGIDDYFQFPEVTAARTIFWVIKENSGTDPSNPRRGLLGHSSGIFWLRGANHRMWDAQASPFVINGVSRINLSNVNGLTSTVPNDYSVISLTTTGNVPATHFTMYFGVSARSWSGDFAEVIIYNQALSTDQVIQVEQYLADSYSPAIENTVEVNATRQFCDTTLCAPSGFNHYLWDNGSTDPCRTFSASGTYTLQVTDRFGRVKVSNYHILFPDDWALSELSACAPDSVVYQSNLSPNDFQFAWSNTTTGPLFGTSQSGDYSVTITDTFGCSVTDTFQVQIDGFSSTNLLPDSAFVCAGSAITASLPVETDYTFLWNSSSDSIYLATVSETVVLTVENTNGCSATDTLVIDVQGSAPQLGISYEGGCSNEAFLFTATAIESLQNITWQIDGVPATGTTLLETFLDPGIHTIRLSAANEQNCVSDFEIAVASVAPPVVTYISEGTCVGDSIHFLAESNQPIQAVNWTIANTIFSTEAITLVFDTPDPLPIGLTITNEDGCSAAFSGTFFLDPQPAGTITTEGFCLGNLSYFSFQPQPNGSGTITDFQWNFGDNTGSALAAPAHYYAQAITYGGTLQVTASNGCDATLPFEHAHASLPLIDFPVANACINQAYPLDGLSLNPSDSIASWQWTINNQSTLEGKNTSVIFQQLGLNQVELEVTSTQGCTASLSQAIPVWPVPEAQFSFEPNVLSTDYTLQFMNESEGQNLFSEWSFGDGFSSTETNPLHTFGNDSLYLVTLQVANVYGCSASQQQAIQTELPLVDLQLLSIDLGSSAIGQELTIRATNAGNIAIPSALFKWQGGGELVLSESYMQTIEPGEIINFTFATQWEKESFDFDYLCVQAEPMELPIADAQPDNNIRCTTLDNSGVQLFPPFPNPGDRQMFVRLTNTRSSNINLRIVDNQGRLLQDLVDVQVPPGFHQYLLDISALPNGSYQLILLTENAKRSVSFVKKSG